MSTIINADTSDGLKFTSDTSGEIKLQSAGSDIATVDSSGITMASGKVLAPTGPAFSAYLSANQTISSNTATKAQFDTEEFDTNSNYDNATNYRFTPTIAGYYQVNSQVEYSGITTGRQNIRIYKNGSAFKYGVTLSNNDGVTGTLGPAVSALVYMNGTTDYIEIYTLQTSGGSEDIVALSGQKSYFQAVLVRAA